ncbi:hypothetical protein GCM10009687_16860 [Asanoa iriomotensis]|uniref:Uncharacterized protein n=1 Tax=Asanoa iriomotensis TaxID=234613 RepID=A0ABQ4C8I4_9ACTN|nr:hypothetical protein Air01nite_51650 [Asanoa iriomotensis]
MSINVTPASRAACTVAMLSPRSEAPYAPDMPIAPKPSAETTGPPVPRVRVCITPTLRQAKTGRKRAFIVGEPLPG